VIDVGANVGHFSAICADLVGNSGQIHAIEASPVLADRLSECFAEVPNTPVKVHQVAVWSSKGEVELCIGVSSGTSSLIENDTYRVAERVIVDGVMLDELVQQEGIHRIRLLKLDIEGAEMDALWGAQRSLEENKIEMVLTEAEPRRMRAFGHSGLEMANLMADFGFLPVACVKGERVWPITVENRIPGLSLMDYLYVQEALYETTAHRVLGDSWSAHVESRL
jgi:FkbM family methyltransferase